MEVQVFRKHYAGRPTEQPHDKGDCTVRALATASGMSYWSAWDLLYKIQGEQNHCHFYLFTYLRDYPERMGVRQYLPFPATRGVARVKLQDFQRAFPTGRYIVQVASHATAIIDGVCVDSWYPRRKCVYGAWEMHNKDLDIYLQAR